MDLQNTIFQVRADSKANWQENNPTLAQRELTVDLTDCDFKVGDGSSTWTNTQYLISRNAAVVAAKNAATSAQSTANAAVDTANNALQIAQNASGRYVDYSLAGRYQSDTVTFNQDMLKKKNTEYEFNRAAVLGNVFNFDYVGPLEQSNIIKVRFVTGDANTKIVSSYFANAITDGKYFLVIEQHNGTDLTVPDYGNGVVALIQGLFVEIEIINGIWFKLEATKLL